MKRLSTTFALLICLLLLACKKNRQCECRNANGTYPAGEVEATKSKAKKHCKDLSSSSTDCYLK